MQKNTSVSLLRHALIEGEESGTANYSLKTLIDEIDEEVSADIFLPLTKMKPL